MDLETANFILKIVQWLVIPCVLWMLRSYFTLYKQIEEIRLRLTTAETQLKDAPSSQSIHELAIAVERMSGNLKEVGARVEGMGDFVQKLNDVVDRQENYLLHGGGNR